MQLYAVFIRQTLKLIALFPFHINAVSRRNDQLVPDRNVMCVIMQHIIVRPQNGFRFQVKLTGDPIKGIAGLDGVGGRFRPHIFRHMGDGTGHANDRFRLFKGFQSVHIRQSRVGNDVIDQRIINRPGVRISIRSADHRRPLDHHDTHETDTKQGCCP